MITPLSTSGHPVAKSLRGLAGVVLLIALGIAPLNYASTRLLPFEFLIELVAVGVTLGTISIWAGAGWVRPPIAALVGALLIGISATVWALAPTRPDWPDFTAEHYAKLVQRWPYSMVPRPLGLIVTWALVGVAGLFALIDFARHATWRRSIAVVMVGSGALVALLGLIQNASRAPGIYWDGSQPMPGAFFGTFFHHTSAGAYLNSVWPLGFALALGAIRSGDPSPRSITLIYGSLLCAALILAAHSGHVSRLPQVIAAGAFVVFTLWAGLWRALGQVRGLRPVSAGLAGVLFLAVVGLGTTRVGDIRARWYQLEWANLRGGRAALPIPPESEWPHLMRDDLFVPSNHQAYPLGDRGAAYATAVKAIAERPWFGWGPGTGWTAGAARNSKDPFIRTFFLLIQFTHSDPLQTCVEWGLVGALGWALLLPASLVHAIPRLGGRPSRDFLGAGAVTAMIAVLLQSLTDFPLQIPAIQFNIAALAALAWSVPGPGGTPPPFSSSSLSHERV